MSRASLRLVRGLRSRGVWLPPDDSRFYVDVCRGQAVMNRAAGEAAPTWYLLCDALRHGRRVVHPGTPPPVRFDGRSVDRAEVCSHMPLVWITGQPPSDWEICWDDLFPGRLNVWGRGLPSNW